MTETSPKPDAYGHLNWTVGNEDWIACFDAVRVGDEIRWHVVVDCESGGFTNTLDAGTVPATAAGIDDLRHAPDYWASIGMEYYLDDKEHGAFEYEDCVTSWNDHLSALLVRK